MSTALPTHSDLEDGAPVHPAPDMDQTLSREIAAIGEEWQEDADYAGAVGRTMFDTPASEDHTVTVLMAAEAISQLPSQALVRIRSRQRTKGGDGRVYLGAVVAGPYAEPDGLRADAPIVVTTTVRGAQFLPRFHGRVQVAIMGEEVDGVLLPPRLRPLPNSPVFTLGEEETRDFLGIRHAPPIDIGYAVGFESMLVQIPANRKSVLPRHLAILGTTGGGKSTTVSGLIAEFARNGMATIVIDTEGEYTEIGRATTDPTMLRLLQRMGKEAHGVGRVHIRHLVGRDSTAPADAARSAFRLDFSSISMHAAAEIMGLSEAQEDRFSKAYEVAKGALRDAGIFPRANNTEDERAILELDEYDDGYPHLTINLLMDIIDAFTTKANKSGEWQPRTKALQDDKVRGMVQRRIDQVKVESAISWNAMRARVYRLQRTNIFDHPAASAIPFDDLLSPGQTTIIDLSDSDSTIINNLAIANLLQGIQRAQERAYSAAEKQGRAPTPVMIIIEEAHEFLSTERISSMRTLFEQVARLARRGRKRWLGLVFVTQLPQHLPDEVLGLVNNHILHKIADANTISRLKRTVGGVEETLWKQLPNLAPGQAIVSAASMTRPMLVTINPTPAQLRMVE